MAACLLVCFIALEAALRAFAFNPNHGYIRSPGWSYQVNTNDLLPYVTGDHLYVTNRFGFRGSLPQSGTSPKIAVMGGSTVEDWVLATDETWPQQLAGHLRKCAPDVWVANLGRAGANIRHHFPQLEHVRDYMPEFDVIVVLAGLNDFLFDYHIHHPFEVEDDWWNVQALMYRPGDEGSLASVAIIRRLWKNFTEKQPLPVSDFGHYQESLRKAYRNVQPGQWVNDLPSKPDALRAYQDNIVKISKVGKTYGARTVFATQPFLWSSTMSPAARKQIYAGFIGTAMTDPKTKWYTPIALEKGLSTYNKAMRDICKVKGLDCVDTAAALPREATYFYDDFHFSEAGAATVGEIVAEALKPMIKGCRP